MFDNFGTNRHLYTLYRRKQQQAKLLVEIVAVEDILKPAAISKPMGNVVRLHVTPITCQTEITNHIQHFLSFMDVFYQQTTLFQYVYLLLNR